MDATSGLLLVIVSAAAGIAGTVGILHRQRTEAAAAARESPFAVGSEGMKLCPSCGMGNLVTEPTCSSCGKTLPG